MSAVEENRTARVEGEGEGDLRSALIMPRGVGDTNILAFVLFLFYDVEVNR